MQKKVKKLEIHFNNRKQIAKAKGLPTLAEKRQLKKIAKEEKIAIQKKKALPHKNLRFKSEPIKTTISEDEAIQIVLKNCIAMSKEVPGLTIGYNLEKAKVEANKLMQSTTTREVIKIKPYKPSRAAKKHHVYVTSAKIDNELKRAEYVKQQRAKKDLRRQKRVESPNRLVCIQKEHQILRTKVSSAVPLVDNKSWKFIPKSVWKAERADPNTKFTLLWEVGRIDLEKPDRKYMDHMKVTSRYVRANRKKLDNQLKTEERILRNRRKRKNNKDHGNRRGNIRVIVKDKYDYKIQDDLTNRYFEFSKQGYKEAKLKYKTLRGIVNAYLEKERKKNEKIQK